MFNKVPDPDNYSAAMDEAVTYRIMNPADVLDVNELDIVRANGKSAPTNDDLTGNLRKYC